MVLMQRGTIVVLLLMTLSLTSLAGDNSAVKDKEQELAVAYNNLGVVRALNNDLAKAAVYLDSAQIVGGNQSAIYNNIGNINICQGDLESAIESYERANSIDPSDHRVLFNWSFALYLDGSVDDAVAMMEQFLSASEDDRSATEVLAVWFGDEDFFKGESKVISKAELMRLLEKAKSKRDDVLAKKKQVTKDSTTESQTIGTETPKNKKRKTTPAGEKSADSGAIASLLYWVFL